MLLTTPISVMAAYGLFVSRMRVAKFIYLALITPMIVPVILIAIGAFYAYVKLKLLHTIAGLVLADTILAIPLVLIVVSSGLKTYDMRSEEHTSELQSLMRISYAVFCLKKKTQKYRHQTDIQIAYYKI